MALSLTFGCVHSSRSLWRKGMYAGSFLAARTRAGCDGWTMVADGEIDRFREGRCGASQCAADNSSHDSATRCCRKTSRANNMEKAGRGTIEASIGYM